MSLVKDMARRIRSMAYSSEMRDLSETLLRIQRWSLKSRLDYSASLRERYEAQLMNSRERSALELREYLEQKPDDLRNVERDICEAMDNYMRVLPDKELPDFCHTYRERIESEIGLVEHILSLNPPQFSFDFVMPFGQA